MPNTVAYIALLVWPLITFTIFAVMRPAQAVVLSLLAGYLLLPVKTAFDFPGIPALDKTTVANLSTYVAALVYTKGKSMKFPREWWLISLIIIYLLTPIFTTITNRDSLSYGSLFLPGLSSYDAFSASAYKAIGLLPFLLGYNLLRTAGSQHELLKAFVGAVLAYSLLMLIEIRLSPQLHTWVYGFFPHSFSQQMRNDGFRPVVFLGHGLLVAIFTAMGITITAYFARRRALIFGLPAWLWLIYLFLVIVLCKSLGALIFSIFAAVFAIALKGRSLQIVCGLSAVIVLTYPALRGADMVPVQRIADYTAQYSEERSSSFQTRINNENQLLKRANERPLFGWGGYGRNRVYDQNTGIDISITDGTWIIVVGTSGWLGYLAAFGILCFPIIQMSLLKKGVNQGQKIIALCLVVNLLDLLPNSSLGPLTWLMAGAVMPLVQPVRGRAKRAKYTSRKNDGGVSLLEKENSSGDDGISRQQALTLVAPENMSD